MQSEVWRAKDRMTFVIQVQLERTTHMMILSLEVVWGSRIQVIPSSGAHLLQIIFQVFPELSHKVLFLFLSL